MIRKWLGLGLLVLCAAMSIPLNTHAQEDGLVLPHPDEIFADDVDILAIGMVADNESGLVYYFDEDDWHFIPYPNDITRMYPAPPGSFNLSAHLNFEDVIFELDTEIATLQPSTASCGHYGIEATAFNYWENYSPSAYENGRHGLPLWLPFEDPISGLTFPCSLETGQLIHPIPHDLRWFRGRIHEWSNTAISPSGEWILLTGDGSSMGLTAVYSFNTTNGNIHYLGEIFFEEITIISFWITDTQFNLFSGGIASWADRDEYVGDITIPNSLEWAFYGIFSIRYFENPPRFELMSDTTGSENSDSPQQGPCVLRMYDFQTNTRRLYDMGSICSYGITIPNSNGDRLYSALTPSGSSALVRLNLDTGTQTILYTGELEGIYSISPDGHYAILRLDDSGHTDFYLNPYPTADVPAIDASDAVLFDLTTNQMVYHFTELAPPENPIMVHVSFG